MDTKAMERALASGARIWLPDEFPAVLTGSGNAPLALWIRGDSSVFHASTIAIVGTRRATTYGRAAAEKFGEHLGRAGLTVLSGGAFGIDEAAHRGAMLGSGNTAAVLGHGIDRVYPAQQGPLFEDIARRGCLVSQYACGVPPDRFRFLYRNELMAQLAGAVLVIEAPEKSGALRTAGAANDLNRPVFVVPGNISYESFRGSHALIRDGATLVDHPDQILEHFGIAPSAAPAPAPVEGIQAVILSAVRDEPITLDALATQTGLPAAELSSELTVMELDGLIVRDGIGYARRP